MAPTRSTKPLDTQLRSLRVRVARSSARWCVGLSLIVVLLLVINRLVKWGVRAKHGTSNRPKFVFVFSTGRCGTLHLAYSLEALHAYVTHEEEHARLKTRQVVAKKYRVLASIEDEARFNESADLYVNGAKSVYWNYLLEQHNATTLVYTGHLVTVFGLAPSIWRKYGEDVKFVRLRRDRISTALSLMALGPEDEDPWGTRPLRWFPTPNAPFVRLKVEREVWSQFNRFQKWLWFVDDVECRWQALKRVINSEAWFETSLEELSIMDGGSKWNELATFMGVRVRNVNTVRHNSIQSKNRSKSVFDEVTLRQWDVQYRGLVGSCFLDNANSYRWQ